MAHVLSLSPTKEEIEACLQQLEGWKPTEEEKALAFERIEWLDQAINTLEPEDELWIRILRRLSAICRRSFQLPSSMPVIDQDELKLKDENEVIRAGQADVAQADWKGCAVAVKQFRLGESEFKLAWKDYLDEVVIWRYSSPHPNVVPFLGTCNKAKLCLVSEWMENGTIMSFLTKNPDLHRASLIKDVMTGLQFIHSLGIIHSDLKSNNVLVDSEGQARLADFGISTTSSATHTRARDDRGTLQYKAPELSKDGSEPTVASDYFSLAHLIWEMFSLEPPYGQYKNWWLIPGAIESGTRPPYPANTANVGLSDELWTALQKGWSAEPADRLEAWEEMVHMFDVQHVGGVNETAAKEMAAIIKNEDYEAKAAQPVGMVYLPPWIDWPHTYGKARRLFTFTRPPMDSSIALHRLLDGSLPKMIFDLSFFEERPLREGADDEYALVPLPEDELDALAADADVKYIDVTSAHIPGWKAHIWSTKTVSTSSASWGLEEEYYPPFIQNTEYERSDQESENGGHLPTDETDDVPSRLLCCLPRPTLPRWISTKLSPTNPQIPPSEKPVSVTDPSRASSPVPYSASIESTSSLHSTIMRPDSSIVPSVQEPPPTSPLAAPVPDVELAALPPVTVRDVLHWLYVDLQQPAAETVSWMSRKEQRILADVQLRREKRPRDKARRGKLREAGRLAVDYLAEDVMFDGFMPIRKDGAGGLELELVLRKPTEEELGWLRTHQ